MADFILYGDLSREAKLQVREFNAAMKVFLNPQSANPIELGEYFEIDTTVTTEQMRRGTGALRSYCYFLKRGRPEPQIIGRGSFLFTSEWHADTKWMSVAGGLALGNELKVGNVTIAGLVKSGLVIHTGAADADYVVGYVMRMPVNNNSFLRYQSLSPYRMA